MDDRDIIALYFKRDENAIAETDRQYGKYCRTVAERILYSETDAEECVNDTYLRLWNTIPPTLPDSLRAYAGRITRNLALDRYRKSTAAKRGEPLLALDELAECLTDGQTPEQAAENAELSASLNRFVKALPQRERVLFVRRYFHLVSIEEMAKELLMTQSNVKVSLHRIRNKLKAHLAAEGIEI